MLSAADISQTITTGVNTVHCINLCQQPGIHWHWPERWGWLLENPENDLDCIDNS